MTKEEAEEHCRQHAAEVRRIGVVLAVCGLAFSSVGLEIERALGLPESSLAAKLIVPQQELLSALSAYETVLENAAKGQLTPVEEEEWSEIISE
jgi:hypothetical protein